MKKFIIPIVCCLFYLTASGQKWEKYLEKEAKYFDAGDYEKGIKTADKLALKSTKSLGEQNPYLAIAKLRATRNNIGLGLLNTANNSLNEIETTLKSKSALAAEDLNTLIELIELKLLLEKYKDANQLRMTADSIYQVLGLSDEDLMSTLRLLEAEIKSAQGYYQQALDIASQQEEYFRNRAGTDRKKQIKRKREYGRLLLISANAYRKMGNYLKADEAFVRTTAWIEEQLGKADILYSQSLYHHTLMLDENGLEKKALEKYYIKAFDNAVRKYEPQHMISMAIKADLTEARYKAGKKSLYEGDLKDLEKTVKTSFDSRSAYNFLPALIENNVDIYDGKYAVSSKRIARYLNESGLSNLKFKIQEDGLRQGIASSLALLNQPLSKKYYEQLITLTALLYGDETPVYHLVKTLYANYLVDYTDDFDTAAEIYNTSFDKIVAPEITEGHKDFIEILNHRAKLAEENDDFELASNYLERALNITQKKYDPNDAAYAHELQKIAALELKLGQYRNAEKHLENALSILEEKKKDSKNDRYQAQALLTQAKYFAIAGDYDGAEENIIEAKTLAEDNDFNLNTVSIDAEEDLANINIDLGRHSDAGNALARIVRNKRSLFGKTSRRYIPALLAVAKLKYVTGEYTDAQSVATRALELAADIYGTSSAKLIPQLNLLSSAYMAIGDLDKAEQISTRSLTLVEQRFGKNHLDYSKGLSQLALIKFYKDEPMDEIEPLFLEAREIISKELGVKNPNYAEVVKNLAMVNITLEKFSKAERYLDYAQDIWADKIGKRNNVKAGEIFMLKGDIKYQAKSYNEADNFYQVALRKYEKFFNELHPEYVNIQSRLSKTYYMKGEINRAEKVIEEVLGKYASFIQDYFPVLSEREKAKFWNKIKPDYEFYNSLIISHKRIDKNLIGKLYDNALITKSLLLNTSKKVRNKILNSNDEDLIATYSEWLAQKEFLSYALSLNQEQLAQNNISINNVASNVEALEKELSKKSQAYGNPFAVENYSWKDIKEQLKPKEVAMEMVRFRYFDHVFTDSILYAVIYTKSDEKAPGLILLENGEQLEKRYLKYYRNAVKFKLNDRRSYEQFWRPVDLELHDVNTIFLSVDGVYNQINLESMKVTDDIYVLDRSNIVLLNNTKDLLKRGQPRPPAENIAVMFGDPDFYVSSAPTADAKLDGLLRSGNEQISELPGTAIEVKNVKELLKGKGWEIKDHLELAAKEGTLKDVNNPKIFHVATHGFFRADEEGETSSVMRLKQNLEAKNPLLKSGLLLTGAGDILNETQFNYNIRDGILTAYEAMNLNLDNTELVVLSACETGLGEVQAGEGVFGLQRAFLVAGAQTVIMSLFKVSDDATQKLMISFYNKWLDTGDKRKSFIQAKKEIRDEFKHPSYWGPFVMLGLDE